MIKLRDYQRDGLAAELAHRASVPEETRLAVVMATGLGKTIMMAERAVRHILFGGELGSLDRVLILVHTDELASQAEAKVRLVAEGSRLTVGMVKAERNETDRDIVIGSVQTLISLHRRRQITDVSLVIVDECHHATADSYQTILKFYGCYGLDLSGQITSWRAMMANPDPVVRPTPAVGFTATLERGDGASLGGVWHDVAFSRGTSWAVRKGWLVQPVGYRLEIPGMQLRGTESATLQDLALVQSLAPRKIVDEWIRLAKDRPTVAFMPLVRSARELAAAFSDSGIWAAVIHGDMPKAERRERLAAYEAGKIQVLVNAMVLTEGWDSPRTKCVIVGRPTKSRPLFIQMAGRGLRPAPGIPVEDQDCLLLVVADSTTDMCTVADLSDKPMDRRTQGALTVMEDAWDIGAGLEDPEHVWTGQVDAQEFDPLVRRSSKVWRATDHGTPFLPIGERGYVFIVGGQVWASEIDGKEARRRTYRVSNLPDLELAMAMAEQVAEDLGGDLGRLLADKSRPWRKQRPSEAMLARAGQLDLGKQVERIMSARAGGKAGKVSDLISKVVATRTLEPIVERIQASDRSAV